MRTIEVHRLSVAVLTVLVALAVAAGCGSSGVTDPPSPRGVVEGLPSAGPKGSAVGAVSPSVSPSHCRPGLRSCRTTEGAITFVERVDPDGDGDAHFVVLDSQSITLPGLTAIDVSKELRPDPLPGVGDRISAAGPVQTGSYGQSQIHALELHVAGQ